MDYKLYRKIIALLFVAVLQQYTMQAQTPQQWRDSLRVLNKEIAQSAWNTDLHLRKAAVNLELQQWQYAVDEYGLILQHEAQNPRKYCQNYQ